MLTTIIAGAFVLGVVVIVHEFGHFIVAKLAGVYVKVFSIGFGKKLVRRKHGETVYAISALPFGGYVKFAGESELMDEPEPVPPGPRGPLDEVPDSEIPRSRYFTTQKKTVRAAVLLAGPFMNYLLAIVLYIGVFLFQGVVVVPTTRVGEVLADGPAQHAGIVPGDTIMTVSGKTVEHWSDIEDALLDKPTEPKTLHLRKDGVERDVQLQPKNEGTQVTLGLYPYVSSKIGRVQKGKPAYKAGIRPGAVIEAINDTVMTSYDDVRKIVNANPKKPIYMRWSVDGLAHADTIVPEPKQVLKDGSTTEFETVGVIGIGPYSERRREGLFEGISSGFGAANRMIVQILSYLKQLFTGQVGVRTLGGPLMVYQMAGDVANWGFDYLLLFLAFFNINLCVFNLMPLPPFDGGHLALLAYEGIARRPVNRRVREWVTQGGFVLVILLMAFVLVLDLTRCSGSAPGGF
ncbi:MAG TPA: RIP metalloprotease RseP [Candidatus Krumholzibacteria bacterium]|nr:RIP metalloprotease RseP [Candidatus Krumholzibacteria bacterium]